MVLCYLERMVEVMGNVDRFLSKAKRVDNGEWVVGYYVKDYFKQDIICQGLYGIDGLVGHLIDPSTLCQCTGLKDKNGQLIFEGDEVSLPNETWYATELLFCPKEHEEKIKSLGDYKEFVKFDYDYLSMREHEFIDKWTLTGKNIHDIVQ